MRSSSTRIADDTVSEALECQDGSKPPPNSNVPNSYWVLGILCFINLINYIDRFTIAGVLEQVQKFYSINDAQAGLIQTSFVICYMIIAPVFGYLGDRYNRSVIMAAGVFFWSVTTFLGSLVPSNHFVLFVISRSLVGIGEASYSIIAPTVISDVFQGISRSRAIAVFYFAIPVGSGLGYIIGSTVSAAFDNWKLALCVTPGLGVLSSVLILTLIKDPPRGLSEGSTHLKNTTIIEDLKYLSRNPSFLLTSAGFTCVTFAIGGLAWWTPSYFQKASVVYGQEATINIVSFKFGIVTCVAGIVGITLGTVCSQYFQKYNEAADPLICSIGLLIGAPAVFLACVFAHKVPHLSWFLIFIGETFLSLNWAIVVDILFYVVTPTRRSIAEALQTTVSHALGDAFSPYITGAISDAIKANEPQTPITSYYSLQYSLYLPCFVLVLGGWLFLCSTKFIVKDRRRCELETSANSEEQCPLITGD